MASEGGSLAVPSTARVASFRLALIPVGRARFLLLTRRTPVSGFVVRPAGGRCSYGLGAITRFGFAGLMFGGACNREFQEAAA
jgi:hypothetical protein